MRFISTYAHGAIDYMTGILLLLSPMLFGFEDVGGMAVTIPRILGIASLLMALMTRFELGVFKLIPMGVHLTIDVLSGLLLAASPWLFGFANAVWLPHVVFGLAEVGLAMMTRTVPAALNTTASGVRPGTLR